MEKGKVLVIGSLNMDWVLNVKEMPVEGETILGSDIQESPGGKGANQAFAAGRLDGNVEMLGMTGKDDNGDILIRNLSHAGVRTEHIKRCEKKTGLAIIYVNQRGNNCITVSPGANNVCDISYIKENRKAIEECDILLVQMEIPHEAVYYAMEQAHKLGKTVILNPAPAPDKIPDKVCPWIDYITPNETELQKLTGISGTKESEIEKGCRILLEKNIKNIIVTLGSAGSFWMNDSVKEYFPVKKVKAVDTTAAGDTFNAALAVYLSEGKTVPEAIQFANTAAAVTVQRKGAQSAVPYRNEIE